VWVEQEGSDEMSSREDDPSDAGVPESDRQQGVGHVDEEADRQGGGEWSPDSKVLRFRREWCIADIFATPLVQPRQMNAQSHL